MEYKLRFTESQYAELRQHLFPADGREAVAILLCGQRRGVSTHVFTIQEVVPVLYIECPVREKAKVQWSTKIFDRLLGKITRNRLSVIKVHSHPSGIDVFSELDNSSDEEIFSSISCILEDDSLHGSLVFLPEEGKFFGRVVRNGINIDSIESIMVVGDDIKIYFSGDYQASDSFTLRHAQLFGKGTTSLLRRLTVGVVGCSGTGSIVTEQLARLGVAKLVLLDDDLVEEKNLNRILNSGKEDAYLKRNKVSVLASAIARMGFGQEVVALPMNLDDRRAVEAIAECDIIFGCMDGAEGRHLLNKITTYYNQPYFDLGVKLEADGKGGIDTIAGKIHYLQPGLSPLIDRRVYNMSDVESEELKRTNPELYGQKLKAGYIHGVDEDRPAVISVNMLIASLAVNDFLARVHSYRNTSNGNFSTIAVDYCEVTFLPSPESYSEGFLYKKIGIGDVEPLLDRPSLSKARK